MSFQENINASVQMLKNAEALLVAAGAGMGVDSGLPDFRGHEGFWNAYPLYGKDGISMYEIAQPSSFTDDPQFGWGFYGHRFNLYQTTTPHRGFQLLLKWIDRFGWDHFIATSNVDGHFEKAGFPPGRVYEIHGSINHIQCVKPCCRSIWHLDQVIEIDESKMRSVNVPVCPDCGGTARPSIPLYGDWNFIGTRLDGQRKNFINFLERNRNKAIVVIEIGAGTTMPVVRNVTERLYLNSGNVNVIRINTLEPEIEPPHISLKCRGLEALELIAEGLSPKDDGEA
jgi:NAD-dependent SIR2 family protein deacetylase